MRQLKNHWTRLRLKIYLSACNNKICSRSTRHFYSKKVRSVSESILNIFDTVWSLKEYWRNWIWLVKTNRLTNSKNIHLGSAALFLSLKSWLSFVPKSLKLFLGPSNQLNNFLTTADQDLWLWDIFTGSEYFRWQKPSSSDCIKAGFNSKFGQKKLGKINLISLNSFAELSWDWWYWWTWFVFTHRFVWHLKWPPLTHGHAKS